MARVSTRKGLIDHCLRRLGEPVIEVNVDPDQIEDRVDDAIQLYQEFHSDATFRNYYAHVMTQEDIILLKHQLVIKFISLLHPLAIKCSIK